MIFICYKNCTTCKKIEKTMLEKGMKFTKRDIKEENPSESEIKHWVEISGLDIGKFFNTSGTIYKEMKLKEKRNNMTLEEQIQLLAKDGMLVKRPILIDGDRVIVGSDVKKFVEESEQGNGSNV